MACILKVNLYLLLECIVREPLAAQRHGFGMVLLHLRCLFEYWLCLANEYGEILHRTAVLCFPLPFFLSFPALSELRASGKRSVYRIMGGGRGALVCLSWLFLRSIPSGAIAFGQQTSSTKDKPGNLFSFSKHAAFTALKAAVADVHSCPGCSLSTHSPAESAPDPHAPHNYTQYLTAFSN